MAGKFYLQARELLECVRTDWLIFPRPAFYVLGIEASLELDKTGSDAFELVRDANKMRV